MSDDVIEELTKLQIKEHFKGTKGSFILTKEELIRFCIKMMKIVRQYEEEI